MTIGNFPILLRTFPNNFGIYFIKDSDATNCEYGLAQLLINFLSLLIKETTFSSLYKVHKKKFP
jgi:hypothetical protein